MTKATKVLLPQIATYGNYSSTNYGAHALRVDIGPLTIWYSYTTPVAFRMGWGGTRHVRANDWGPTTGKHLNAIDGGDKRARLSAKDFEAAWAREVTPVLGDI